MTPEHPTARGVQLMVPPGIPCASFTDADGTVHAEVSLIRTIGIRDLTQVIEHRISHAFASVGHFVRFSNGGSLRYVFNHRGDIVDLYFIGLDARLSPEGDMTVWAQR